jgi:hypothetical protein
LGGKKLQEVGNTELEEKAGQGSLQKEIGWHSTMQVPNP